MTRPKEFLLARLVTGNVMALHLTCIEELNTELMSKNEFISAANQ